MAVGNDPSQILAFEANSDGDTYLAVTGLGDGDITILLGDGAGNFSPSGQDQVNVSTSPRLMLAGDFTSDGADLVTLHRGVGSLNFLDGDGAGSFARSTSSVGNEPLDMVSGNFNADGNLDLAIPVAEDRALEIILGDGAGGFSRNRIGFEFTVRIPRAVDLRSAGKADLLLLQRSTDSLIVLRNVH